jgi:hypothetical protein
MSAPNHEEILRGLAGALTTSQALAELLQFGMDIPPQGVFDPTSPVSVHEKLQQVLNWAIRNRRVEQLVAAAAARSARRDLQELHQRITTHGIDAGGTGAEPKTLQIDRERFAILCNRDEQWTLINTWAVKSRNELVFIPGAEHQGHRFLVRRIASLLEIDPKSVIDIGPPGNHEPQPTTAREMLELFGRRLGVESQGADADVAARIADRLAYWWDDRPLVVIPFTLEALPEGVQQYYSHWLPTIASEIARTGSNRKSLHYYQPVKWREDLSSLQNALNSWLASDDETAFDADEASEAVRAITGSVDEDRLFVTSVQELEDITDEHLTTLCGDFQVADRHIPVLIQACKKKRRSQDKLDTVNKLMATFNPINPVNLK